MKNGNFAIIMKLYSYSLAYRVANAPGANKVTALHQFFEKLTMCHGHVPLGDLTAVRIICNFTSTFILKPVSLIACRSSAASDIGAQIQH